MKWIFSWLFSLIIFPSTAQEFFFRLLPSAYGDDIQQIKSLFEATDRMVWIGTDKGLYSFDGKNYRYASRPDRSFAAISTIAEISNGEIWAGYDDGYVQVVSVKGFQRSIDTDSLSGFPVSKILFHPEGQVFIATYGKGLWWLDEGKLTRVTFNDSDKIIDIYDALIDDAGKIWMGTDLGIWIYQHSPVVTVKNINKSNGLPDEIVTHLNKDHEGNIWIGFYDHGVGQLKLNHDTIATFEEMIPFNENVVRLINGHENDVWFATDKSVSHYISPQQSLSIKLPEDVHNQIQDILIDHTANLWIAAGNKLFIANTQLQRLRPGVDGVQAIASNQNLLWLGCEKGLFSYDRSKGLLTEHLAREKPNILSIYIDKEGLLWIGTFGEGLFIYDPNTKRQRHLTEEDKISNNSILNIDGTNDDIWLATLGGITQIKRSVDPINISPDVIPFNKNYSFPAGYVYDVFADKNGKIWFATDGKGVFFLQDNKLMSLTGSVLLYNSDSFDLRTVYSITGDNKNNLWISSTKGNVLGINPAGKIIEHISSPYGTLNSLNTAGDDEIIMVREGTIQVKNQMSGMAFYTAATGLNSFSPNINATWKDQDGSVWIADTDEIIHYRPLYSDTGNNVQMHLMDMTPGALYMDGPVRLRHDSNFLDFRFTGLWYPDPESVGYRYMLEGHDEDWIYTKEGRAVYSRLSPGTYTFLVAGAHHGDFTNSIPIKKEIIVLPPFYFTWWFILGSLAIISFLVYRFTKDRIKRLKKLHQLEKEKTTLQLHAIQAQVNPHFLFNSFNTLSGIIEEDQKAAVDYVDQMSDFFRGVLMHRNAELITVAEELEIMRNYTYILKKRYGGNIITIEEITSTEGFIAPLSLQMLVENAIKHNKVSNDKPLTITIKTDRTWLTVCNPLQPKFNASTESTGFGLSSLLTRYQYLTKTKIEIINDGKDFIVRVPIIHLNP